MIDINLIIALAGIAVAAVGVYYATRNSDKELESDEREKIRSAAYKEGTTDKTLSQVVEITSRTESKVDGVIANQSEISKTANDAKMIANKAKDTADKAHTRIDGIEKKMEVRK